MATFSKYPKKAFSPSQNFLARDPASSGQVIRVQGQSIIDAAVADLVDKGAIVQAIDTLTAAIATDYQSGTYVLTGGGTLLFDGDQKIYRVSDPGFGGIVMANGNELVLMIGQGVIQIDSVEDIAGFVVTTENQQLSMIGWHPDSDVGGGVLYWDSAALKSTHNGGTIFSPTVPWTTTTADYLNAVGETDPSGAGCWVRVDGVLTVEMFGANGTINSDRAAFIACATVADGALFVCSTELLIDANIELLGIDVNCEFLGEEAGVNGAAIPAGTSLNEKVLLRIEGSLGDTSNLTADLDSYAVNLPFAEETVISVVDGGLYSSEDILLLESDQLFDDAWTGSVNNKRGELVKIASISGNDITTVDPAYFSYAIASNAKVTKVNTVSVGIDGGVFTGGGVGSVHTAVDVNYGLDIRISGSRSEKCEDTGFNIRSTYIANLDVTANECTSPTPVGNTGYGVAILAATRYCNVDAELYKCRHAVSGGGDYPALHAKIKGSAIDCGISTNAWDCHEPCFEWVFDVTSSGGDGGMVCRGSNITISIESVGGSSTGLRVRTFGTVTEQNGIHIKKAIIKNHKSNAFSLQGSDSPLRDVTVDYVETKNTRLDGVLVSDDAQDIHFGIVKIDETILNDGESTTSGAGFRLRGTADSVKNISVDKLIVSDTIKENVKLTDCSEIDINYIDCVLSTGPIVEMDTCNKVRISSGRLNFSTQNTSVVFTDSCTDISVHDCEIIGDSGSASQDGWRGVDTIGISMRGCRLDVGRHGGFWDGTSDDAIITSNDARNVVNGDKFNVTSLTNVVEANNLT